MSFEGYEPLDGSLVNGYELDHEVGSPNISAKCADEALGGYKIYSASELLRHTFPERAFLLGPWLEERTLAMIYGARGVGKSLLTLSIAIAVASGRSFLNWQAGKPSGVLYVDGEMAGDHLQERVRLLAGSLPNSIPLHFLARDMVENCSFTLGDEDFAKAIRRFAGEVDAKLIILDNLSTLWRGKENEAESWDYMQDWLIGLRQSGRSVLIVHHAGKSGQQRGTSRKEDSLDIVLALRKPESVSQSEGACFSVIFEKSRSKRGKDVEGFHATLRENKDLGLKSWERSPLRVDSSVDEILALQESGLSQAAIAKKLGKSPSAICRAIAKAKPYGHVPGLEESAALAADEEAPNHNW